MENVTDLLDGFLAGELLTLANLDRAAFDGYREALKNPTERHALKRLRNGRLAQCWCGTTEHAGPEGESVPAVYQMLSLSQAGHQTVRLVSFLRISPDETCDPVEIALHSFLTTFEHD